MVGKLNDSRIYRSTDFEKATVDKVYINLNKGAVRVVSWIIIYAIECHGMCANVPTKYLDTPAVDGNTCSLHAAGCPDDSPAHLN